MGQQSLSFAEEEGQGLEASLSQKNRPRYPVDLELGLWALDTVSSPYLVIPMCFYELVLFFFNYVLFF